MNTYANIRKGIKNQFQNLKWRISHNFLWDIYSLPNNIYRKCKKDFAKPKCVFHKFRNDSDYVINDYICCSSSIITIDDIDSKYKWGTYRFEWLSHVTIKLFGWNFVWVWISPTGERDNLEYYETMMNYLWNYNKDIELTKSKYSWQRKNANGEWESSWNDNWLKK